MDELRWMLRSRRRSWEEVGPGSADWETRKLASRIAGHLLEEVDVEDVSVGRALTVPIHIRVAAVLAPPVPLERITALVVRQVERSYRRCDIEPQPIDVQLRLDGGAVEVRAVSVSIPTWAAPPDATLTSDGAGTALVRDGMVLGRDGDDLDGALRDPKVSRTHAEIVATSGRWSIRDLGSRHGTRLDGEPVGDRSLVLPRRCSISLGPVTLQFSEALGR